MDISLINLYDFKAEIESLVASIGNFRLATHAALREDLIFTH